MTSGNPRTLTVTQLTSRIKQRLSGEFSSVWVRGEISGLMTARSGHLYFNLKDREAQISAMIWQSNAWRIKCDLRDGMEVACLGNLDVYPPRGTYQISVREIHEVGIGARQQALRRLHEKLRKLGWFDAGKKKPLPRIPNRVAVVTSPEGAAIRDFLQVAFRRWPKLEVTIVPSRVQGEDAGSEIAAAIRRADRIKPAPDVIVVTRGGGSAEDLWCFNDEVVCEAIFQAQIPVVSGVGHEVDVSLCDLVADCRALTPSEAAERLVPDRAELQTQLVAIQDRLKRGLVHRLESARVRLESLASRNVLTRPLDRIRQQSMNLDLLNDQLNRTMESKLRQVEGSLLSSAAKLESLSPLGTLARGYSLTTRDGRVLRDASEIAVNDVIETKLEKGKIVSRVERCE